MTCKYCGSSKHSDERCSMLGLSQHLLNQEVTAPLPEHVFVIDATELFSKSEKELHDEIIAAKHLKFHGKADAEEEKA